MIDLLRLAFAVLASLFKSRAELEAENLVLRRQVNVLRRRVPKRPALTHIDRLLLVWLHRWFPYTAGGVYRILDSAILVVKTAKDRSRCNGAEPLDNATERRVLAQRSVSSEFFVIVGIPGQDPAQVRFAQDHDMIQAVSSDRADEPFDMSILPGRARRRWSIPDPHGRKTSRYGMAIGGISVSNEIVGRLIPGEASVICWAIQSAVGLAVTFIQTNRRRSRRMMTNP